MAQKRGGDGGDGLRRERRGGLLQSESPSDSAGRQTGFLIGEPTAGAHLKRIRDNAKRCSIGYQLVEQLQLFCRQLGRYVGDAGNVRAGPVEVGDKNPADAFVRGSQHRRRMSLSQCTNYRWRTAAKGQGLPPRRCWHHDRCTPDSGRLAATPKSAESAE